jgi:DNA-binding GntR family transcriptional regulator
MSEPFSPIDNSPKTLAAQVQARIRDAILNRRLKPGERIDQNRLAEEFNVSIVPVREALKGLEAEGLVSIVPRRGAFVTAISRSDLDDLYFARQLIEGETIAHAVSYLTEDDFAHLESLITQMRQAIDDEDIRRFMVLNRQFHMRIYSAPGNQHLIQLIQHLWERSELYRYRFLFVVRSAETIHQEHEEIVKACRARDAAHAREMAIAHIRHTQDGLHLELAAEFQGDET